MVPLTGFLTDLNLLILVTSDLAIAGVMVWLLERRERKP